jgi:hypothetical protein
MRIGRKVIVTTNVSLNAPGSILTSSTIAVTASQVSITTVVTPATPAVYYRGWAGTTA